LEKEKLYNQTISLRDKDKSQMKIPNKRQRLKDKTNEGACETRVNIGLRKCIYHIKFQVPISQDLTPRNLRYKVKPW
jgi:hypothetical protein